MVCSTDTEDTFPDILVHMTLHTVTSALSFHFYTFPHCKLLFLPFLFGTKLSVWHQPVFLHLVRHERVNLPLPSLPPSLPLSLPPPSSPFLSIPFPPLSPPPLLPSPPTGGDRMVKLLDATQSQHSLRWDEALWAGEGGR